MFGKGRHTTHSANERGKYKNREERVNHSFDVSIDCGDGSYLFLPAMYGNWYSTLYDSSVDSKVVAMSATREP